MRYKPFKNLSISTLGLGGLRFPELPGKPDQIDYAEGQRVVDAAFSCGINYIDTAYTYQNGESERFLGKALSSYPRGSYYLASKFYVEASRDIEAVFTEQLARLRTDYFDFYLLHCLDENTIGAYMDEEADYLGYLLRQKEAGRIRYLGFSSHAAPETLKRFLDFYDDFDMALIQLNYLDWSLLRAGEQYEALTARGIPVWVMEPLKGGILSNLSPAAAGILKAAAPGRSLSSWGFRFLMELPNVQTVLSGMSSVSQVLENAETFDAAAPLTAAEKDALEQAVFAFSKEQILPCSGCRYCCSYCPAELNIPLLIQGLNEKTVSGETWRIAELEHTKGADACLQCGACLAHCPQKLPIPQIMKRLSGGE